MMRWYCQQSAKRQRYDIATMQASEGGEFTCVGVTKDPAVFWHIRNVDAGGASVPIGKIAVPCRIHPRAIF
jgi:hypothetical protein